MRRFVLLGLSCLVALLAGCGRSNPTPELRWRFLGGQVLRTQTNAPVLRDVLTIPEAAALAGPLATNLATAWWNFGTGGRPVSGADLAQGAALMSDLIANLSVGEAVAAAGGGRDFAVAIQVPADRVGVWQKAWPAWIQSMQSARGGKPSGAPLVVQRDVWLLAVSDSGSMAAEPTLRRLAEYPPVTGSLLQFDAAVPSYPAFSAAFVPTNGIVRLTGTITTLKGLPNAFPSWEMPPAIREPMVQFTALRGFEAWGQGWLDIGAWTGGSWPAELYTWGQEGFALRSYLAARVKEPTSVLDFWYKRLQPSFDTNQALPKYHGRVLQVTNPPGVILDGGLPALPVIQEKRDGDRAFVTVGVVPMGMATNPPAPGMIARMNRPNVLLYDWEFTSEAVKHWHALAQLPELFEGREATLKAPGSRWLLAASRKIGETVTEATVTGDREISVMRKAPAGLNALELTALVKWLDPLPPLRSHPTNNISPLKRK